MSFLNLLGAGFCVLGLILNLCGRIFVPDIPVPDVSWAMILGAVVGIVNLLFVLESYYRARSIQLGRRILVAPAARIVFFVLSMIHLESILYMILLAKT